MSVRVPTLLACALLALVTNPALASGDVLPTGPVSGDGAFVMQTCGESGSSEGWSLMNASAPTLAGGTECPPQRGHDPAFPERTQQSGLWVSDRLLSAGGSGDTPADARVELSFVTAPQTTISRIRFWRMVSKDFDEDWEPYIARGDGLVIDSCSMEGTSSCNAGGDSWYPDDEYGTVNNNGYVDLEGLSTVGLRVGLHCKPNSAGKCLNGTNITRADAAIYSAFLTITDAVLPSLGAPSGAGWTADGWVGGTLPLALPSSDNTGISATRVYADGSLVATLQGNCSYTKPAPCADEPTGAVGLPTAGLADGGHAIELAAVDAAGNEQRIGRPTALKVDNEPPAPPVALMSSAAQSSTNRFAARWSLPADAGSPIVAAEYQLCQAGRCGEPTRAPSLTSLEGLVLPAAGAATLRVWLVDDLGHADPARAAQLTLVYAPPSPLLPAPDPTPPPDPGPVAPPITGPSPPPPRVVVPKKAAANLKLSTTRRVGQRVTVSGRMTSRATGRVSIRYRVRLGKSARSVTRHASIRRGRFSVTFTLPKALARPRRATITASYAGNAKTAAGRWTATLTLHR
jgi:hypothetical protein